MKFKAKVAVEAPNGRFIHTTHADNAIRRVEAGQAIRISSGTIQLLDGNSLGSIRRDEAPKAPKRPEAPKRRNYHDKTSPKPGSSLPHLFRADSGQIGSFRTLTMPATAA